MRHLFCGVSMLEVALIQAATMSVVVFLLAGDRDAHGTNAIELRAWHHFYLGLLLLAVGIVLESFALRVSGCVLMLDDAFQHAMQVFYRDHSFRSPLALLYVPLYRIPLVRRINRWLDARLS